MGTVKKILRKNIARNSWSPFPKCMGLVSLVFLFSITFLKAMNEEREDSNYKPISPPQQIHIVSPEGVAIIESLKAIAITCPKVARPIPIIESREEFKVAKDYLGFSKKYGVLLSTVGVLGPRPEVIEQSQRVLKGVLLYVDTLQSVPCKVFRSEAEEKELEIEIYDINHRIAQNHLLLLTSMVLTPPFQITMQSAESHIKEIKRIKEIISKSASHRKSLQEAIENAQTHVPGLISLFKHGMKPQTQQPPKKLSKKIAQQKIVSQHKKIGSFVAKTLPENLLQESFDLQFHCTADKILTEELSLSSKGIKGEAYVFHVQKLTDEYIGLEQEGAKFRAKLHSSPASSGSVSLSTEELTDLYRFFSKRYTLPQKNPLQLLGHIIVTFIHANKVGEALARTEVLRTLLLEKGELSDEFASFRAGVLALNGKPDEWIALLEKKRKVAEEEKILLHQQTLQKIKKSIEKSHKEQEEIDLKKELHIKHVELKAEEKAPSVSSSHSYTTQFCLEESKVERVVPKEKIKTRPSKESMGEASVRSEQEALAEESRSSPKDYKLSNNVFKTYRKIRNGDPKFPRKDLYNLFEKLGCRVDISQGKGDHGKISAPITMTITKEEEFIAVIPEFTRHSASNSPLPLTVLNWDEKWDGRAPPYMMSRIVQALDFLGATDETVHK